MHLDDAAAFGQYLRATRERHQITLEVVAHRTKIAPRLLAALERGDVSAWPPGIYRRAMMRAYADAAGVDREIALERFGRLFDPAPDPPGPPPAPAPAGDAAPWLLQAAQLVGAATLVAIAVAAVAPVVRRAPQDAGSVVHAQTIPAAPRRALPAVMPAAVPVTPLEEPVTPLEERPVVAEAPPIDGRLTIESDPAGAVVTVNGIRRGVTPLTIGDVPLGRKRVRLILDGYVSQERVAVLTPEETAATIQVMLVPRQEGAPSADRH